MTKSAETSCDICGGDHVIAPGESCPLMAAAAAAGAQPSGVSMRVYGGYIEARTALKKNASVNAATTLRWLLGHLAEERGASASASFEAKLDKLCADGIISPRIRQAHFEQALGAPPEQASWALMSIVEHALYRLYLQPRR